MKIAIVNDIHVGKGLEHEGHIRASSHLVEESLERVLMSIKERHSPDLLINMGDLIRSESQEHDLKTYSRLIGYFKSAPLPVIHLLGNHELKRMPLEDIEAVWRERGFHQDSFGLKEMGEITLIWLGLELEKQDHRRRFLPKDQLAWLQETMSSLQKPAVIFTHCPFDDHAIEGNFFYEACDGKSRSALFLENHEEIRRVISSSDSVIAVLQAHLHYFHAKEIDGVPYITCPAMGDNICGPNVKDNVPEIYTILTLQNDRIVAKAYSGKYCFSGYESPRSINFLQASKESLCTLR